ncbi:MAG: NUDIX hydrolase [bacterium]
MRITAGGVLVKNGRILLGRRRSDRSYYPGVWDIFGGHCEQGEAPEQTFIRELEEELGVTPRRFEHIGSFEEPHPETHGEGEHHLFLVQEWIGNPANLGAEHDSIGWFTREELSDLDLASSKYIELFGNLM